MCASTARLYTSKRGRSGSTRPISKKTPSWVKYTSEEVESLVLKLAREGNTASTIGMLMRDRYGVPLVKSITGRTIHEILAGAQQAGSVPEDLGALVKKADDLRRHLDKNRKDHVNKRSLAMIESKIHRLVKYYHGTGQLKPEWEYKHVVASVA
ncbi:MAG TPA: 30S ribosomal protein S15 [Candidatus Acidoferrales bacterium]|nr:30S ribosomal protein S15 [Candidatus Acidoferrales bacterium]